VKRQNPTDTDRSQELTPQQQAAVDALAAGSNVTAAADKVGVSRQTVSEWLNRSFPFRAALGQRRSEIWESASDRLRSLLPKALDVLERELDGRRLAAATAVLRAAGLHGLGGPAAARTAKDIELDDQESEAERRRRALFGDLIL